MIHTLLERARERDPDGAFLIDRSRVWTRDASHREVARLSTALRALGLARVMTYVEDSADLVHLVLAASAAGVEITVANRLNPVAQLAAAALVAETDAIVTRDPIAEIALRQIPLDALLAPASVLGDPPSSGDASLVILTSGTSGSPRGARYAWSRLLAQVRRRDDQRGSRWVLLYQLNHFAGLQVLAHVLANDGSLVIPATRDAGEVRHQMVVHRVTHASGTPTFWRMFCGTRSAAEMAQGLPDVQQITLGGEASTAELLVALRHTFPKATLSQVYATTELGSCFSVHDDRPGFPAAFVDDETRTVALRISNGQLFVRSRSGMTGYTGGAKAATTDADGWTATGDLVERVADRIEFRGRDSETINVGGVKVHPFEVETVIASVPGVLATRVYGKPNPLTGALVAAEVVVATGYEASAIETAIRAACRARLHRYAQPRLIDLVTEISTINQKIARPDPQKSS